MCKKYVMCRTDVTFGCRWFGVSDECTSTTHNKKSTDCQCSIVVKQKKGVGRFFIRESRPSSSSSWLLFGHP